jgi:hypothetical protein
MIPLFVIEHGAALLGQWKLFRNIVAFYVRSLACTLVWGTTFTANPRSIHGRASRRFDECARLHHTESCSSAMHSSLLVINSSTVEI